MKMKSPDKEMQEKAIKLKDAALKYECAPSSLKSNIKNNNLRAEQENEKAPYMVRPSDVETFLRERPGIKSTFHPKSAEMPAETLSVAEPKAKDDVLSKDKPPSLARVEEDTDTPKPVTMAPQTENDQLIETIVPEGESPQSENKGKRRRPRRRGKGGGDHQSAGTNTERLVLRTLSGATPKERLRLTALLSEMISIIGSA